MPASPSPDSFLPVSAVVFDILLALAGGDLHGYDIMREVDGRNGGSCGAANRQSAAASPPAWLRRPGQA